MTVQAALEEAMHHETPAGVMNALVEQGVWMADEDTMTAAIHNVYCGIMADHAHPNEKDRDHGHGSDGQHDSASWSRHDRVVLAGRLL